MYGVFQCKILGYAMLVKYNFECNKLKIPAVNHKHAVITVVNKNKSIIIKKKNVYIYHIDSTCQSDREMGPPLKVTNSALK